MQSIELFIERYTQNRIGKDGVKKQSDEIAACMKNRAQAAGVVGEVYELSGPNEVEDGENKYYYSFKLFLKKEKYRSEPAALKCLENAKRFVQRACEARGWKVKGDSREEIEKKAAAELRTPLQWTPFSKEIEECYFGGIYERNAHIRLIHASTKTYLESGGDERNHTLLYGDPAACKSVLFERFKKWYDDDCERVLRINATSASKAGLENFFLEKTKEGLLPEIIWFDEIEKFANETDLSCLLGIMDGQGKIAKLNAKIGRQEENIRVLIWGTCNNIEKLQRWNAGALWSRFTKKLPCVRPSKDLMLKILLDKIDNRRKRGRKASDKWAEIAVNYGFDVAKTNDPRTILGYLDGGEELEDGTYFKYMEEIEKAARLAMTARLKLEN